MDRDQFRPLFEHFASVVTFAEPMARHTTWRIGGPADIFAVPHDTEQLLALLQIAKRNNIPFFIIGRGSNLLVRDAGIRGLVIKIGDSFADCSVVGNQLIAYAGRSMVSAAHIAIRHGLSGLEFATGIPGSIGGAVAMNAGAHGGEIKDVLARVEVVTKDATCFTVPASELQFAYRHSVIRENGWIVLSAVFDLRPGDTTEMQERTRAWAKRRQATQPLSMPSCGSVFRNPPGDYSARLIEACGLKGTRIGDAQISEKHANFIVNLGQARALDVLALIDLVKFTVQDRFGVQLLPEVRVVGEN